MAQLHELWEQARSEHPDNPEARGHRYVELMREAGLIVPREPGDDSPMLPCGWPNRAEAKEIAAMEAADDPEMDELGHEFRF